MLLGVGAELYTSPEPWGFLVTVLWNCQAVFSECDKEAMNPGKGSHLRYKHGVRHSCLQIWGCKQA